MPDEIDEDRFEAEERLLEDPLAYALFNPAQLRVIRAVRLGPGITVVVSVMGNGTGKSFSMVAVAAGIMFATANPLFSREPFGPARWPFVKDIRFVSTTAAVQDTGPLQKAMKVLYPAEPADAWSQTRGSGKGYYSQGWTKTGFTWDVMTYNQALEDFASHTKGAIFFSEPPPEAIFNEAITRLRGRGLVFIEMTPLTYAAWVKERLIDPGGLYLDDKKVGDVNVIHGDFHENCGDHNEGGQLTHQAYESQVALWPEEEREARKSGAFMALAGRIYRKWGPGNELEELPAYHQECWDKDRFRLIYILDPHDRKPWAMKWTAVFPNEDVITVAEWPGPGTMFHRMQFSPINDIEDYREMILGTEMELIGRYAHDRTGDPNFLAAPKSGQGKTVAQMLGERCRRCKKGDEKNVAPCPHSITFRHAPDDLATGHMVVRQAIGNPDEKIRPKTFALKASCPNTCYSMRSYGFKENTDTSKGLSERPELINKDFADLERYLHTSGLGKWPVQLRPQVLVKFKKRGNRVGLT